MIILIFILLNKFQKNKRKNNALKEKAICLSDRWLSRYGKLLHNTKK